MFKVLVVAYNFPPMGLNSGQRSMKFVKYMKNFNWEPTVISTSGGEYIIEDKSLLEELNEKNIKIIRIPHNTFLKDSTRDGRIKLRREFIIKIFNKITQTFFTTDNKSSWAKKAFIKTLELLKEEKFDAIFVTAPPFSVFGIFSKLKNKINIPLIIDYRELWNRSFFSFYPTPVHKMLNKKMEYNILKAADTIIVSNRKIKEKILNDYQFLTFNDILIITNGFDKEDFDKAKVVPKHNRRMIIMYSGIFQIYNTPKYFLKAFKELSIEMPEIAKNIELHFLGFIRKENKRLIRKLNLQEFIFDHGYVSHKDSIAKLLSSDVLWMTIWDKKNIDAFIPGKFYEYLGAKKPVIACVPEGAAKIAAEEYIASYICNPRNINEMKETIVRVYNDYKASKFPQVDDSYITNFSYDFLTEKLTKEFQFLIKADVR